MEFCFRRNIVWTFRCTFEGGERGIEGARRVVHGNGQWKIILVTGLPIGFEPELWWCTSGSCRTTEPAGTVERILFTN